MLIVSFNVGYDLGGWTILSPFPTINICENMIDIANGIREDVDVLYSWSEINFVPPETIRLYITIKDGDYNRNFTLKAYNIREYRNLIELRKN
jgi:hypothetical protein